MLGRAEFEDALRLNKSLLAAANVTIQGGEEAQAVSTGMPEVPEADPDREVIWTVDRSAVRFNLAALLAKPEVAPDTALNATNAIVHSMGSALCMLARSNDSKFLFSADAAGAYLVSITVSSIDLEPWARRSNAEQIPPAKLPPAGGGSSLGNKVADLTVTGAAAVTRPLNARIPQAWTNLTSGYAVGGNAELRVPKTKEVIGWVVKALVDGAVIDTTTLPKMTNRIGADAFGPVVMITFKNNARSDVHVNFRAQTNFDYHIIEVRGDGNEIPARATLELYEWL